MKPAVLAEGKHVLAEKTPAQTVKGCDLIVGAAARAVPTGTEPESTAESGRLSVASGHAMRAWAQLWTRVPVADVVSSKFAAA
jgi:hypothetical protein